MPKVRTVLARKGTTVWSVRPAASVLDAARLMNRHAVGALLVREGRRLVGIFTERDVLRRVVAERLDPAATDVGRVMTRDPVTCRPGTELDAARDTFMRRRVRHLPVVDDAGEPAGMISIGDLNAFDLTGQELKIAALEEVIYGTA
ncbi:MAG: CBS domain-containing protein [Planctomycetota bacterium]